MSEKRGPCRAGAPLVVHAGGHAPWGLADKVTGQPKHYSPPCPRSRMFHLQQKLTETKPIAGKNLVLRSQP